MRERITTTEAKAKELKNHIDQLINKGKRAAAADKAKRQAVLRDLRIRLSVEATQKISGAFAKRFETRKSGYVRVVKLDARKGDGAKMAVIEFV